jgi:hypothetical protein
VEVVAATQRRPLPKALPHVYGGIKPPPWVFPPPSAPTFPRHFDHSSFSSPAQIALPFGSEQDGLKPACSQTARLRLPRTCGHLSPGVCRIFFCCGVEATGNGIARGRQRARLPMGVKGGVMARTRGQKTPPAGQEQRAMPRERQKDFEGGKRWAAVAARMTGSVRSSLPCWSILTTPMCSCE